MTESRPTGRGPGIAFFVTGHGFGHAARCCAVIEELLRLRPQLRIAIWSDVPGWFFEDSIDGPFHHRTATVDPGLVQDSAFDEDIEGSVRRLLAFVPSPGVERELVAFGPRLLVADIAPGAIAMGLRSGMRTLLLENFTWDWILAGYPDPSRERRELIRRLRAIDASVDVRLQTEPVCRPRGGSIRLPPISRRPRRSRHETRQALGIRDGTELVFATMGGIRWDFASLVGALRESQQTCRRRGHSRVWVLAGAPAELADPEIGLRTIPHRSEHYHPDLVAASDVVVAKLGYSTLAEVARAGPRLIYVRRERFRESQVLSAWADEHLRATGMGSASLPAGQWIDRLLRPGRGSTVSAVRRRDVAATTEAGEGAAPNGARLAAEAVLRAIPDSEEGDG